MTTEANNSNLKSFINDDWCIEHIDDNGKLILLLNNVKFTATLERILDNDVNQNVIIDEIAAESGLVYYNNTFNKMKTKDIVKKTMEKLFKQLSRMKDGFAKDNKNNIDINILETEINVLRMKYDNFLNDQNIQDGVTRCVSDLFFRKKKIAKKTGSA